MPWPPLCLKNWRPSVAGTKPLPILPTSWPSWLTKPWQSIGQGGRRCWIPSGCDFPYYPGFSYAWSTSPTVVATWCPKRYRHHVTVSSKITFDVLRRSWTSEVPCGYVDGLDHDRWHTLTRHWCRQKRAPSGLLLWAIQQGIVVLPCGIGISPNTSHRHEALACRLRVHGKMAGEYVPD